MQIRRIHPIEMLRMQGWDLEFWRGTPFDPSVGIDADLVGDQSGMGFASHIPDFDYAPPPTPVDCLFGSKVKLGIELN